MSAPTTATSAPAPDVDPDSAPYWAGLKDHRVVVQECEQCHRRRFPPTPACPYCATPGGRWVEADGSGEVFSFIVVHRAFDPAFAADVPYTIATVDLDGGGRIIGRTTAPVTIGTPVRPDFADHPDWTELRFAPEEEA
jgi:uncharacterized OB-fold protein